ncbi:hypothetical protein Efla_004040 [Eimeria flavescens]
MFVVLFTTLEYAPLLLHFRGGIGDLTRLYKMKSQPEEAKTVLQEGLNSRAQSAEIQVISLLRQVKKSRRGVEEAQVQADKGHRVRGEVTPRAELDRAREDLRETTRQRLEAQHAHKQLQDELGGVIKQRDKWHRTRIQLEEMKRQLFVAAADAAREMAMEQHLLESQLPKCFFGKAQV